ncbi:condensation domain-containing protein [Streptomyces sp. H27-S2]|uniref:condensation domain-containing protein n=1 Tax=Streptomyces antarcticus TaxID=2996458 RepID=UPI00227060B5|nr:condensation domain-containing protein [Streptomyces sp. H27-S2]MCY0950138.1 condensation domain-containing protein [Streptomyces sp. H27-S2]
MCAQQLDPSRLDHTIGAYLEIRGAVDPVLLAEAVRLTVAGTDALRVRFAEEDGTVRQIPAGPPPLRMETADVTGCADPDAESERLMRAELARPTDLGAGDVCRFLRVFPVGAARGPAVLRGSALFGAMVTAVGAEHWWGPPPCTRGRAAGCPSSRRPERPLGGVRAVTFGEIRGSGR